LRKSTSTVNREYIQQVLNEFFGCGTYEYIVVLKQPKIAPAADDYKGIKNKNFSPETASFNKDVEVRCPPDKGGGNDGK